MAVGKSPFPAVTGSAFAERMALFAPFESHPTLAVAVSGGADSMALCLLAHHWAVAQKGNIIALTVDHGLRASSATEAKQVGAWLKKRGIAHHILTLPKGTIDATQNMQASARDARYEALSEWCHAQGILHLITAHHLDDQAETFLIRLARGSGVDGLSGMSAQKELKHVQLLRPLLNIPKSQLVAYLAQQKQDFIEDPSNVSDAHTRNRIRKLMPLLEEEGLSADRLVRTAQSLALSRIALEEQTAQLLATSTHVFPEGYASIDRSRFKTAPADVAWRAFAALISTLSGDIYKPRLLKLKSAFEALCRAEDNFTFGGCFFSPTKDGRTLVMREQKAITEKEDVPHGVTSLYWDNRFTIALNPSKNKQRLYVAALGASGYNAVKEGFTANKTLPKKVIYTLPALWGVEAVLEVPHMGYICNTRKRLVSAVHFSPAKPLAGSPFCGM